MLEATRLKFSRTNQQQKQKSSWRWPSQSRNFCISNAKGCQRRAPLPNRPNHHPLGSTAMPPELRTPVMNVHLGKSKRNDNGWCREGFKKAASVTADTNSVTYIRDLSGGSRRNSPAFLGFNNHPYNVRSLSCWLQNVYIRIKTEKSFGEKNKHRRSTIQQNIAIRQRSFKYENKSFLLAELFP